VEGRVGGGITTLALSATQRTRPSGNSLISASIFAAAEPKKLTPGETYVIFPNPAFSRQASYVARHMRIDVSWPSLAACGAAPAANETLGGAWEQANLLGRA